MRRLIAFASKGHGLMGTLDEAAGTTGILIVSGGNEPRMGAHRGMAMLAADLASAGVPVFRFDRRGVGDSSGENDGFLASQPDIFNAASVFGNAMPQIERIVGFGNCDAASALALFGRTAGIDAVVLANPWLGAEPDAMPPAAAIRTRYAAGLRSPAAWWRLMSGGVDLGKLVRGMRKLSRRPVPDDLAARVMTGIVAWGADATIVLAAGDATALAFAAAAGPLDFSVMTIDTASHSFAGQAGADLRRILLDAAQAR